jgi:DNA-binding transcriptional LysR family regulator
MARRRANNSLAPEQALEGPVWREYASTFVAVFLQIGRKHYSGFKELFWDKPALGEYRTGLKHLDKVAAFFVGPGADHNVLFDGRDGREGMQATDCGLLIYRRLMTLSQFIQDTKRDCQDQDPLPLVRIGASRTIGLRLIPSILSTWNDIFGRELRLEVEIGNTRDLVEKMKLKTMDFIVSYGDKPTEGLVLFGAGESKDRNIAFKVFQYPLNLILLCHWQGQLLDTHGRDRNKGYCRATGPDAHLPRIALDDIDFTKTKLIVSESWWRQPESLTKCVERLLPTERVQQVLWFQETLAQVRLGLGIGVVSEVYKNEDHVNAFALSPANEFRKWIGVYYNAKRVLPLPACRVATFIGEFLRTHVKAIRRGEPPICDQNDRRRWEQFDRAQKWDEYRDLHFPTRTRK